MSDRLKSSIRDLRIELQAVTRQLASISERLGSLESETEEGFCVVSQDLVSPRNYPQEPTGSEVAHSAGYQPNDPSGSKGQSWADREEISRQIGTFLRRALNGEIRGPSGRDRIKQSSKYYIVVKDYHGRVYTHPAKIFTRWGEVKAICCSAHGEFGDSVFVGLPSLREVRVALRSGGFSAPEDAPDEQ